MKPTPTFSCSQHFWSLALYPAQKTQIRLETAKVERADISESVTATGTVESVTQVDVGTQVTGIVDKPYADYNSVKPRVSLLPKLKRHSSKAS